MNGLPIISGVYYYWNDKNNDKIVQPSEVDLDSGPQGFYHIDPSFAPGTPNVIAPDYKAPTTDEFIVGFDHELMTDFAVSAAYTYRYITNIQRSPLVGVTANDYVAGGFATGTAVGTNGFTLNFNEPYYKLNDPVGAARQHLREPARRLPEIQRRRGSVHQADVEQVDDARQLRLQRLAPVPHDRIDREQEQPPRGHERQRRTRRRERQLEPGLRRPMADST